MLKFVRFNFSALIFYQRKCDTRHGSNFPFPISIYIDRVNDFIIIFGLLLNSSHHTLLMDGCIYNMKALSQRNYGALYYIFFKVVKLNNGKRSEKRFSKRILFLRKKPGRASFLQDNTSMDCWYTVGEPPGRHRVSLILIQKWNLWESLNPRHECYSDPILMGPQVSSGF